MRIGIDIDGVLTDLERFTIDYFTKFCFENNLKYSINESDYDLAKTFNVDKKSENDFWHKYLFFYATEEKARTFAAEVIKKLKEEGHEIYIITARELTDREDELGQKMKNTVAKWLSKNNIVYDRLIFSREKERNEEKVKSCHENKIDLMIEDSPININQLSKLLPVICFDTNYNRKYNDNNIYRCFSWYDIYKTIKDLTN